jgi:hypothetical protein
MPLGRLHDPDGLIGWDEVTGELREPHPLPVPRSADDKLTVVQRCRFDPRNLRRGDAQLRPEPSSTHDNGDTEEHKTGQVAGEAIQVGSPLLR